VWCDIRVRHYQALEVREDSRDGTDTSEGDYAISYVLCDDRCSRSVAIIFCLHLHFEEFHLYLHSEELHIIVSAESLTCDHLPIQS